MEGVVVGEIVKIQETATILNEHATDVGEAAAAVGSGVVIAMSTGIIEVVDVGDGIGVSPTVAVGIGIGKALSVEIVTGDTVFPSQGRYTWVTILTGSAASVQIRFVMFS